MLDIRIPIGLLFTVLGVLVTAYGIITNSDTELYTKSFQYNVNLWSGLLMLVFGVVMLLTVKRKIKNRLISFGKINCKLTAGVIHCEVSLRFSDDQ